MHFLPAPQVCCGSAHDAGVPPVVEPVDPPVVDGPVVEPVVDALMPHQLAIELAAAAQSEQLLQLKTLPSPAR